MAWPSPACGGSGHPGPRARRAQVQEAPVGKFGRSVDGTLPRAPEASALSPEESLSQPRPDSWRLRWKVSGDVWGSEQRESQREGTL